MPIATVAFPSNWQLSSARAASVVTLFANQGVAPARMSVAGFGEYRPAASNDSVDGRNQNRRVLIVIPRGEPSVVTADIDTAEAAADPAATPLAQQLGPIVDPALGKSAATPKIDHDNASRTTAAAQETHP